MGGAVQIFLLLYTTVICLFLVNTSCVYYCLLLVVSCLLVGVVLFLVFGFGWYSLLLCLVYVGGVYILFVFVSVQSPNARMSPLWGGSGLVLGGFVWILAGLGLSFVGSLPIESSSMLCSGVEGPFYVCLCLVLLFGFVIISLVMSLKVGFYR
uniref:NADH dehydrogenase subunit 6 n=1 Tax=Breviscolex orientalis TaxID=137570 RepID=A0A343ESR3_9CEST|nr:NADH dehydrogenase subunit 6 [Breviscolex orientalis]ASL24599.1 NADH dehydrogenase subunit 6 [Breviscolex orientalis]